MKNASVGPDMVLQACHSSAQETEKSDHEFKVTWSAWQLPGQPKARHCLKTKVGPARRPRK